MHNIITCLFLFLSLVIFWNYVSAAGKDNLILFFFSNLQQQSKKENVLVSFWTVIIDIKQKGFSRKSALQKLKIDRCTTLFRKDWGKFIVCWRKTLRCFKNSGWCLSLFIFLAIPVGIYGLNDLITTWREFYKIHLSLI